MIDYMVSCEYISDPHKRRFGLGQGILQILPDDWVESRDKLKQEAVSKILFSEDIEVLKNLFVDHVKKIQSFDDLGKVLNFEFQCLHEELSWLKERTVSNGSVRICWSW